MSERIETREVLAECYRRLDGNQMLTHSVVVENRRAISVLCNRVRLDCLADGGAGNDTTAPPTCPRCLTAVQRRADRKEPTS